MNRPVDRVATRVLQTYKRWSPDTPHEIRRLDWDLLFGHGEAERRLQHFFIDETPAAWIDPPGGRANRAFLYLHGGGFQVGSMKSHADLVRRLCDESGVSGLLIDYRLAPEHQFPAALDDSFKAYRYLFEKGFTSDSVAIAGDSAGGNLAIGCVLKCAAAGTPPPAAVVLLSPWTDLQAKGESYKTRAQADPIHQQKMILRTARIYLGDADPSQPMASPLGAEIKRFPSTLIQVGDCETVLDDALAFAAKLKEIGVDAECVVWPDMIHVFQQFPDELPEAREAIAKIAEFLRSRLFSRRSIA